MTQGDIADGLYIVVSGRLRLSVETGDFERVLHDAGRGSIVGELALLSDQPRAATVRAQRDSDLLLLRASSFATLVQEKPAVLRQVVRLLVDRLLVVDRLLAVDGPRAQDTRARTLTIAQAGSTPGAVARVADLLTTQLAAMGSVLRLDADAIDRQLGPGAAQRGPNDPGRGEVTGWLHAAELDHDHVVYVATARTLHGAGCASASPTWRCWPQSPAEIARSGRSSPGRWRSARSAASWCCFRLRSRWRQRNGCATARWRVSTTSALTILATSLDSLGW